MTITKGKKDGRMGRCCSKNAPKYLYLTPGGPYALTVLYCSDTTAHRGHQQRTGGRSRQLHLHRSVACSLAPPAATRWSVGRTFPRWILHPHCTSLQLQQAHALLHLVLIILFTWVLSGLCPLHHTIYSHLTLSQIPFQAFLLLFFFNLGFCFTSLSHLVSGFW